METGGHRWISAATKAENIILARDRDDLDSLLVPFPREGANDKGRSFEARPEAEGGFRANDIRERQKERNKTERGRQGREILARAES